MKNNFIKFFIIILIIFIILLFLGVYILQKNNENHIDLSQTLPLKTFENEKAKIDKYTLYGTHFNINGSLKINSNEITKTNSIIYLIIENIETKEEKILDLKYTYEEDIIKFYTSDKINQGINLEEIQNGNYKLYLKLKNFTTKLNSYYHLENISEYDDLEYYTITKNNSNNKIDITFSNETLNISCNKCTLPENVYDIVIDPGHGGTSTGTKHFEYIESEINYDVSVALKESLEKLGLKVLLTRNSKEQTVDNYNIDGRAVIPNKVKAKLCLSIHNNSSSLNPNSKGIEIYCPNFANLAFGHSLADNIVKIANSSFSPNTVGLINNGVYVLKFDEETIEECKKEAIQYGYEPYSITTDTNLFFMIREVGGICTGAYIDGRDKITGINPYVNSNIVAESYLLELGYVSNREDIENVINNKDKYVEAITKSIKELYAL